MEAFALPTRRWTSYEYRRMVDAGIIGPEEHVQLLAGEIVTMAPQNRSHAMAVRLAQRALESCFPPDRFDVQAQLPLALGGDSLPEPDVAVVAGSARDYPDHPSTALLVIEVADSTLRMDRQRKGPLYAGSGIAEYWIVNLVDRVVEVYREPIQTSEGWTYRLIQRLGPGDRLAPLAAGESAVDVADLLP
jgi:Uma2 family endonuclease